LQTIHRWQLAVSVFLAAGLLVILVSTGFAIRTFMVSAAAPPLINRFVFRFTQELFGIVVRPLRSDARRQRILSLYAPFSLLVVLAVDLILIGIGYTLAFYGAGIKPMIRAFLFSASALSTLGFESPGSHFLVIMLSALEALTVATVVALLIGYLPGIYSSYQQREQAVDDLDELAGTPPDGAKVLTGYMEVSSAGSLGNLWSAWIAWFKDLGSSGKSLSGELYLRSSSWDRSWICAAGSVLDAASLAESTIDLVTDPAATRLVRTGTRALHQVLQPLQLVCPDDPEWPATPINITRAEFDDAYDALAKVDLPMKTDRDAAWEAFAQLRVQYECQLMALVRLKRPPRGARWTTDRPGCEEPLPLPVFGRRLMPRKPSC
jgi:hypothetical protein